MPLLTAARVVTPTVVHEPGWVEVQGRRIAAVGGGAPLRQADLDLGAGWLLPGFVDLHCHGGGGRAYSAGDPEQAVAVADLHLAHGTTTTLASLVSAPPEQLVRAVDGLAELVQEGRLAGIHLEGPYLSPRRCGAHDPDLLVDPEPAELQRLLTAGGGAVSMVTVAPERRHGLDAVRAVVAAGAVAAVGHTDAGHDVVRAAVDAGASVATHLFNGMPPLHHREPGPVGALLGDERVTVELICDGVHLDPSVIALTFAAAGADRVALVTDAMAAAGAGDGDYLVGELAVRVRDGVARLAAGGSIAGSTLTADVGFRVAVACGVPVLDASRAASATPARVLGREAELGAIEVGLRADLVALDEELTVQRVMRAGAWV